MPIADHRPARLALAAGAVVTLLLPAACSTEGSTGDATSGAVGSSSAPTGARPGTTSNSAPTTTRASGSPRATVTTVVPAPTRTAATRTATTRTAPSRAPAPDPVPPAPRGTVIVLNPGHNGGNASHPEQINRQVPAGFGERKACDTTGTNTDAGYPEHAFTWDLAKRIRAGLQAAGITVRMTRDSDTGVGPCVDERAAIGNRSDVTASVSLHADGAPSSGRGFHVNQDSRRPDGATARVAAQSLDLGRAVHRTLERSSGLVPSTYIGKDGYYYRSDLAGLNLATRPTTFLELGNMRNPGDAALLSSRSGRARIASAVTAGILAWLRSR